MNENRIHPVKDIDNLILKFLDGGDISKLKLIGYKEDYLEKRITILEPHGIFDFDIEFLGIEYALDIVFINGNFRNCMLYKDDFLIKEASYSTINDEEHILFSNTKNNDLGDNSLTNKYLEHIMLGKCLNIMKNNIV